MKLRSILYLLVLGQSAAFAADPVITTGQSASSVLGQSSFTTSTSNSTASTLSAPRGAAVDPTTGKFYISDRNNNRVLRYASTDAYLSGASAEIALGQTSTASGAFNTASSSTMFHPGGLAFDNVGRLYVADTGFNRVLRFNAPSSASASGITANAILGQPDATTTTATITASGMNAPEGVVVSSTGEIFVADSGNHRVLRFAASPSTGASANLVLGQPNFATNTVPSAVTAANLYSPEGLAIDEGASATSLWVVDRVRDRVLRFDDVANLTDGASARVALGQASLTAEGSNTSRTGLSSPYAVAIDATSSTSPRTLWIADTDNNRVLRFTPAVPVPAMPAIGGKTRYSAKKASVVVKGTASGAAGLSRVQYKGAKGGYRSAQGTTSWSFRARCKVGKNRFTIVAVDKLGRQSPALTIIVKRKK